MDEKDKIIKLEMEVAMLSGVISQHDLCHDLHGKVNAKGFDRGCIAEQKRIYNESPSADMLTEAVRILNNRVHGPEGAWNAWMFEIDRFLEKYSEFIK